VIGDLDRTWRGLEVRHLVALEAVARAGTFRGAARDLGYSQSALSDQIAGLERVLGRRLVERPRGSRSVRINPAGALVLASLEGISSRLAVLQADLRALDTERTTLRVGIYQTASTRLLPRALPLLRRDHPEVDVTLDEAPDDGELLRRLGRGDLDVAFAGRPVADESLVVRDLLDDPYLALVPAGSAFAAAPFLALRTLLDEPLIDHRSARSSYHVSSRLPGGFRPTNVVFRTDDTSTVHALVAAGIGIAVLPRLGIDEHDPRVRAVPVEPPLAPRQLVLAWLPGSGREAAIEAFAAAVIAAAGERAGPERGP
jgi:molybdate transport repressor ModE-like protein